MPSVGYYGTYARFMTDDKQEAIELLTADNIVGTSYTVEHLVSPEARRAWLVNPFGKRIGYIDEKLAEELDICAAKGWINVALLALVAFTESDTGGYYWGEVAIISYDPCYSKTFCTYIAGISKALASGIRPNISLGRAALVTVVEKNGDWLPSDREALPTKTKKTVFIKTSRSLNEQLIEQARKHKLGCGVIAWAVLLALVSVCMTVLRHSGIF